VAQRLIERGDQVIALDDLSTYRLAEVRCAGAFVILAAIVVATRRDRIRTTPRELAYLAVFGSVLGFSAYLHLLRRHPPAVVATYAFVNPIVAMFLGFLLAGESLSPRTLAAAAVVLAAVLLITTAPPAARHEGVTSGVGMPARRP